MSNGAHVFVDESSRPGQYRVCAVSVVSVDVAETRKRLRTLTLPGQRRVHFAQESDRRRKELLSAFAELGVSTYLYIVRGADEKTSRREALVSMVHDLVRVGVCRITLESREPQDSDDRSILYAELEKAHKRDRVSYEHSSPIQEPILWIPDGIAWADGRGRRWRRRLEELGLVKQRTKIDP